jgi:6,7-dimethyl-8-ribityllumazine synthase
MKKTFGIVVSRFNEDVTSALLKNCLAALKAEGFPASASEVVHVPGGYEIPWAAQELAASGSFEVVITLGCVLRGATPQNEHIARSLVQQLHNITLKTRVPVILGVITPNTYAQAVARTRGALDRGKESALAAVEMLALRRSLGGRRG